METIFVPDGTRPYDAVAAQRKRDEVTAYLYTGWEYAGWGSAPADSTLAGLTGFYFRRVQDTSGPGFGAAALRDRLASGLHAALVVSG